MITEPTLISPETDTHEPRLIKGWDRIARVRDGKFGLEETGTPEVHGYLKGPDAVRVLLTDEQGRIAIVRPRRADDDGGVGEWGLPAVELAEGEDPDCVVRQAISGTGRRSRFDKSTSHAWEKYIKSEDTTYCFTLDEHPECAQDALERLYSEKCDVMFVDVEEYQQMLGSGEFAQDLDAQAAIEVALWKRQHPYSAAEPNLDNMGKRSRRMVSRLIDYVRGHRDKFSVQPIGLSDEVVERTGYGERIGDSVFNGDWLKVADVDDRLMYVNPDAATGAFGVTRKRGGNPDTILCVGEPSHAYGWKGMVTPAGGAVIKKVDGKRVQPSDKDFEDKAFGELEEETKRRGIRGTLRPLLSGVRGSLHAVPKQLMYYAVDINRFSFSLKKGDESKLEATSALEVPFDVLEKHLTWFLENVFTDTTTRLGLIRLVRRERQSINARTNRHVGRHALSA